MKEKFFVILILLLFGCDNTNKNTSVEVLKKSIEFHDPNNQWPRFNTDFQVKTIYPDSSIRLSSLNLNVPDNMFSISMRRDSLIIDYIIDADTCNLAINGDPNPEKTLMDSLNVSCDRALMYRDYYSYLYGLPMKLKDPGTILKDSVESVTFKNKAYLKLTAGYKAEVGSDYWNFYLNPKTYALEVYQFFKTDDNGNLIKDSGEYILLSELEEINGIKMPKTRDWYYNKDDQYLGTDVIIKNTSQE